MPDRGPHPILDSVAPVVAESRHVRTDPDAVEAVARWLAYEGFEPPTDLHPGTPPADPDTELDLVLLANSLDFAFTDFATSRRFEVVDGERRLSDSDAMFAGLRRALDAGVPVTDGAWMASVDRAGLARVFTGTIEMPLLDERVAILNEIGSTLAARYGGRWSAWVRDCDRALRSGGDGLLERIEVEFPRYRDRSRYHGHEVVFAKLAQLGLWSVHCAWVARGEPGLRDVDRVTAFADYIVPLALEVLGITRYAPELSERIAAGDLLPRDSDEEIELRAHAIHATALLADACNALRPPERRLLVPEVDHRLWKAYHATHRPHHLTRTVMY